MARPWATPKRAPTAWASAWLTPRKAFEKASPAIVAALAMSVRAREVAAVGDGARQRVEDQVDGLQAERVRVRRREDRDVGLQRVGERVDPGVGGQLGRHAQRERRIDDRHVGDERVVDKRELALAGGDTAAGETSDPVPEVVGTATRRTLCSPCG